MKYFLYPWLKYLNKKILPTYYYSWSPGFLSKFQCSCNRMEQLFAPVTEFFMKASSVFFPLPQNPTRFYIHCWPLRYCLSRQSCWPALSIYSGWWTNRPTCRGCHTCWLLRYCLSGIIFLLPCCATHLCCLYCRRCSEFITSLMLRALFTMLGWPLVLPDFFLYRPSRL